jgi:ERCC4-type nuclease
VVAKKGTKKKGKRTRSIKSPLTERVPLPQEVLDDIQGWGHMDIIVDSREDEEYFNFLVHQFPNHKFTRAALKEGDFQSDTVLVERKTLMDLNGSIMGNRFSPGRLPDQISRLACHEERVVLFLIVGDMHSTMVKADKDAGIHINPDIIYGQIASIMCRERIHIIWQTDEWESLITMIKFMQKVQEGKYMVPTKREPKQLIARLLGVTPMQAEHLGVLFGSLANIAQATPTQLQSIVGIGPAKATKILTTLNERW